MRDNLRRGRDVWGSPGCTETGPRWVTVLLSFVSEMGPGGLEAAVPSMRNASHPLLPPLAHLLLQREVFGPALGTRNNLEEEGEGVVQERTLLFPVRAGPLFGSSLGVSAR